MASPLTLSVAVMVEEAAARAGPWDGDVPFVATLELLVDSCRRTGALTPTGSQVLHKAAVRHLRNLRYLQAFVDDHPDVTDRPLDAPLVVTGLPRTGTTLLHNLLACDPAHRVLRFWEALHPVPPHAGGPSAEALQAQAARWLEGFYRLVPEFRAIHGATPTAPEECDALLQNTFASQHFDDMFDAVAYSEWLADAALTDEYQHYAFQLRVLSADGEPGTTWALKSPSHLGHLDALLAALPGCTVVVCHRQPHRAVASYASLVHALRRAYSDDVSPVAIGRQALERAATAMGRALAVRSTAPPGTFVDVPYRELVRDPISVVRTVYEQRGRALEEEAEERMRRWARENPQHKHGPHRYALADFGLTTDQVDAAFAPYMERFGPLAG
ncbi:MAG: sulfotransferase [Actinomycetota bacterium]|nr:sulfotransferase [Actinomycetota bacterium]